ncbi:hypothetical protein L914_00854, partial [Phytophthora nicotianae]
IRQATRLGRYCMSVATTAAFQQLLCRFKTFYNIPPPTAPGRPQRLRYHRQVLCLVFSFYLSPTEQTTLCLVFGVPPSTLSRTLYKAVEVLTSTLKNYVPTRISRPSPARQVRLERLVEARKPFWRTRLA